MGLPESKLVTCLPHGVPLGRDGTWSGFPHRQGTLFIQTSSGHRASGLRAPKAIGMRAWWTLALEGVKIKAAVT